MPSRYAIMKIGLWNIDHPEKDSGSKRKQQRFDGVADYLASTNCDVYILNETNSALNLNGYIQEHSLESPFKSSRRYYGSTNKYYQVSIYSKEPISKIEVSEPVNSLQVKIENIDRPLNLYGNVVTIKDRWKKNSKLKYRDRLEQQIESLKKLPQNQVLIAGDFNLRIGWSQKKGAYNRLNQIVNKYGLIWPTKNREDTVQHILHSPDISVNLKFDFSVKYDVLDSKSLSDHPFIEITTSSI